MTKPNIILVGIGHSGTSIVARMLEELGWNLPHADNKYAECDQVRQANRRALHRKVLPTYTNDIVQDLKNRQPWVIKDPRFTVTLHLWAGFFAKYELSPLLLWLKRDLDKVRQSYRRRREFVHGKPGNKWKGQKYGMTVDEQWDMLTDQVERWDGPVFILRYEQLTKIHSIFKPS